MRVYICFLENWLIKIVWINRPNYIEHENSKGEARGRNMDRLWTKELGIIVYGPY